MKKRIILTLVALVVLVALLGGIKAWQIQRMIASASQFVPPPEPVTTAEVRAESWESVLTSVGSLAAVQGVMVTAELPGKVERIAFTAGATAKKGALLVQQDVSSETAQLRAGQSRLALAKTSLERVRKLLAKNAVSQSEYDSASAQFSQAEAEVDNIRSTVRKKTIRAPFAGRLGIRLVNLGQVLGNGEPIVSLQSVHPIFVNFLLPQQDLARVKQGLKVRVSTNVLADEVIEGAITAINPQVDSATRNIEMQATLSDPKQRLRPGMFVNVTVVLPEASKVLAIPATAVLYATYSDSVFVVEESKGEGKGASEKAGGIAAKPAAKGDPSGGGVAGDKKGKVVRQQFVRLGERRGDFVVAVEGLEAGETVVSSGVFKLRNGQAVVVDNTLKPELELAPKPPDR